MTDIEIASTVKLKPITETAKKLGIDPEVIELYGKYKAKLPLDLIQPARMQGKHLILVSAISPTPAGEGKTTISIGLTEGLNRIGKKTTVVLREPSLGPVFGIKGGATGGGYSQVLPMEDINLHFTGDFNAIEKAHNLLAALIDNNIQSKTSYERSFSAAHYRRFGRYIIRYPTGDRFRYYGSVRDYGDPLLIGKFHGSERTVGKYFHRLYL